MIIFAATSEEVIRDWHAFRPLLERFERTCQEMSVAQIRAALLTENQQLWGLRDSERVHFLCTTEILQTVRGKVCLFVMGVGTAPRKAIQAVFEHAKAWARSIGCVAARIIGRPGWARFLKDIRVTGVMLEQPL